MRNHLVYDVPTRLFHWLFALLFIGAFLIGKLYDDHDPQFIYHVFFGLTLAFLTVLRLVWGFVGTQYARWSSFKLNPSNLVTYFTDILQGRSSQHLGHNPASSWSALAMLGLALGLGVTGYLMEAGINKKLFKEIHELIANGFLVMALLHVAGVVWHVLRHRDGLGFTMLDGKKTPVEGMEPISSPRPLAGLALLVLLGLFALNLQQSYDPATQRLTLLGSTWQIVRPKKDRAKKAEHHQEREHREEHHD